MSDDDTLDIRAKAERAMRLLADPTFREFVAETEAQAIEDWKMGRTVEERELAHAKLRGVAHIEHQLRIAMNAGEVAEFQDAKRAQKSAPLA